MSDVFSTDGSFAVSASTSGPVTPTALQLDVKAKYLGVDPGPLTGIAQANRFGQMVSATQVELDDLAPWLHENGPWDAIVCENYIQFSKGARGHMRKPVKVSEAIGVVRGYCALSGTVLVMANPLHLETSAKWAGVKIPSGRRHGETHFLAGWAHLFKWMVDHGICKTALEQQIEAGN